MPSPLPQDPTGASPLGSAWVTLSRLSAVEFCSALTPDAPLPQLSAAPVSDAAGPDGSAAAAAAAAAPAASRGAAAEAAAASLAATSGGAAAAELRAVFAAFASAGALPPSDALGRLRRAGAFDTDAAGGAASPEQSPFVQHARALADTLPKHWAPGGPAAAASADGTADPSQPQAQQAPPPPGAGVGGGAGGAEAALAEKAWRQELFLQFLQQAGAWALLTPAVRSLVLEAGEMVCAIGAVRSVHNEAAEAAGAGSSAADAAAAAATGGAGAAYAVPSSAELLQSVVQQAGVRAASAAGGAGGTGAADGGPDDAELLRGLSPAEMFYARASAAEGFFASAAAALHSLPPRPITPAARWALAGPVCGALRAALEAAAEWRRAHAALYPPATAMVALSPAGPQAPLRWTARTPARGALRAAVEAACGAAAADSALLQPALTPALRLCEALLDGASAAVSAEFPRGPAHAALLADYRGLRSSLVPPLFAAAQHAGAEEAVAPLAEAHRCFPELWALCEAAGDEGRLHRYMRELRATDAGAASEAGFAEFVFERLRSQGRALHLLEAFPAEFNEGLRVYLQPHPQLLWLHLLRMARYGDAAAALLALGGLAGPAGGGAGGQAVAAQDCLQALRVGKLALLASETVRVTTVPLEAPTSPP